MTKRLKGVPPNLGKNIKNPNSSGHNPIFDYPVFCLRHVHKNHHLDDCTDSELASLIMRMHKLSTMTWKDIQMAPRHGMGTEKISQDSIKTGIPAHITPDVTFYALRFEGKKPFVGYRSGYVFHVVYIDRNFTLYDH
ncbi:MAG TPA: hypothetical protein VIM65_23140 [Cyclobacteriaceae bacterium]